MHGPFLQDELVDSWPGRLNLADQVRKIRDFFKKQDFPPHVLAQTVLCAGGLELPRRSANQSGKRLLPTTVCTR